MIGSENIFHSASGSQFVATGPVIVFLNRSKINVLMTKINYE